MNYLKYIFILLVMLNPLSSQAGQSRDMLDGFLKKTTRMEARFQQKLLDQRGILLQQSAGTFVLSRPGKFIWDYQVPYPQQIVSNGTKIWIYDSELEQVTVKPYDQVLTGAPVILLDQRKNLDEDFIVEDKGISNHLYWLVLKPKDENSEFKEIRIGMANNLLRTMLLLDTFEQTTVIEFEQLKVNPKLDSKRFEFIPPKGTDVVGDF